MKNVPVTEVLPVSIVTPNHNQPPILKDLLPLVDQMPEEDRAALLEKLLGKQNSLSVVFGNHQLNGSIVVQINQAPPDQLAAILKVVAERIAKQDL
jgi:hypothetical protein